VECLFPATEELANKTGVLAVACATGGISLGFSEELSLHEQAERIAGLFDSSALTGEDATPRAVLNRISSSRFLHLAAHGTQDPAAPLFSRIHLADGALHAHEILEQDLRGVELVTLSACESAMLRFDFLDNLHGLGPAFLRAGAGDAAHLMNPGAGEGANQAMRDSLLLSQAIIKAHEIAGQDAASLWNTLDLLIKEFEANMVAEGKEMAERTLETSEMMFGDEDGSTALADVFKSFG